MLKLYYADYCPYCQKVIAAFKNINLEFELIDAAPGTPGREKLLELGGKAQIPFLVDGEKMIYESSDIIEYAKKTYSTAS